MYRRYTRKTHPTKSRHPHTPRDENYPRARLKGRITILQKDTPDWQFPDQASINKFGIHRIYSCEAKKEGKNWARKRKNRHTYLAGQPLLAQGAQAPRQHSQVLRRENHRRHLHLRDNGQRSVCCSCRVHNTPRFHVSTKRMLRRRDGWPRAIAVPSTAEPPRERRGEGLHVVSLGVPPCIYTLNTSLTGITICSASQRCIGICVDAAANVRLPTAWLITTNGVQQCQ